MIGEEGDSDRGGGGSDLGRRGSDRGGGEVIGEEGK